MSQVAEAWVRIRPDFTGFKTAVLTETERKLTSLQTSVLDTENVIKRAARENITSNLAERESLGKLHAEYKLVAENAEKGSAIQVEANRLAADSARKLGLAYKESASGVSLFGRHASATAGEANKLERGLLAGSGAASHMGRSLAFASTAFLGAAGFASVMKASISEAGLLQAQMNRINDVFDTSAETVLAWSKTSARAMGLARAQALESAGTMGTLLKNIGVLPAKAAEMSITFTKLAADMAAFKKVAPDVAIHALEAALQGRTRSLKQFGIVIDSVSLKAEAMKMGLLKSNVSAAAVSDAMLKVSIATEKSNAAIAKHGKTSVQAAQALLGLHEAQAKLQKVTAGATGTLTAAQKSLATYGLVLQQTKNEQGTFARSQGELVVQQMKFHAALKDLEGEIGTALLPVITKYTADLADWMAKAAESKKLHEEIKQAAQILATTVQVLIDVIKVAWAIFDGFSKALGGTKTAVIALLAVLAVNKFRGIAAEAVQVALKFGLIGTASTTAEGEVVASFAGMEVATVSLGATIKAALITTGIGLVIVAVGILAAYVLTHWDKVKTYTEDLGRALVGTFKGAFQIIEGMVETAAGVLTTELTAPIRVLLEGLSRLPFIGGKFKGALHALESVTTDWVKNGVKQMQKGGEQAGGAWGAAFSGQVSSALAASQQQVNLFSFGGAVPVPGEATKGSAAFMTQSHVVATAITQVGIPYQTGSARAFGGKSALGKPTDCSGLVHNILSANGVSVPATSQAQWAAGTPVIGPLQPGDLMFYNNHINEKMGQPGHVTMYIGNSQMIEDPHTGASARIVAVRADGYMGARRYIKSAATTTKVPDTRSGTGGATTVVPPVTSLTSGATAKKTPGLLSATGVISMKEQLSALGDKAVGLVPASLRRQVLEQIKLLTDAIHKGLGPQIAAGLRKDIADVRTEINDGLRLDKGVASTKVKLNELKTAIMKFPAPIRAQLAPLMKQIAGELSDVQKPSDLTKAKSQLKRLTEAIRSETTYMHTLLAQHVKRQLALWQVHLKSMQQAVSLAKTPFETAFGNMTNLALTLFDRNVQKHIDAMQADLNSALGGLDTGLSAQLIAIQQQQQALTPTEKIISDLQAQREEAARQKAIADAKKQQAADVAAGAPADQLLADQQAVDDALYEEQLSVLQKKADAERVAADALAQQQTDAAQKAHDDAAVAKQKEYDAAVQNYQDQQDIQRTALDQQLQDLKTHLELRGTKIDDANQAILTTMEAFGLDPTWFTAGANAGSALVQGLSAAFAAASPTLQTYQDTLTQLTDVQKAKPVAPTTASERTAAILSELKKQTQLAQEAARKKDILNLAVSVTPGADTNVNQVARDALR